MWLFVLSSQCRASPEARVPLPPASTARPAATSQPLLAGLPYIRATTNFTLEGEGRSGGWGSYPHLQPQPLPKQLLSLPCPDASLSTDRPFTVLFRLWQRLLSPEAATGTRAVPKPLLDGTPLPSTPTASPSPSVRCYLSQVLSAHLASGFFAVPPCWCHLLAITPGMGKGHYWWPTPTLTLLPETTVLTHLRFHTPHFQTSRLGQDAIPASIQIQGTGGVCLVTRTLSRHSTWCQGPV